MTLRTLILRSLRFHWRGHLGVLLGAAIGSAALIGALVVGDSVRVSLRELALQRLGHVHFAMDSGDRLFRVRQWSLLTKRPGPPYQYSARMGWSTQAVVNTGGRGGPATNRVLFASQSVWTPCLATLAPVLKLAATVTTERGDARANQVQLLGVDSSFAALARAPGLLNLAANEVVLNRSLAEQLGAAPGDTLVVRTRKPEALATDSPVAPTENSAVVLRLKVRHILPEDLGNFSLAANQVPPFNAFVSLPTLQEKAEAVHQANLLLADAPHELSTPTRRSWRAQILMWLGRLGVRARPAMAPMTTNILSTAEALARLEEAFGDRLDLLDVQLRVPFPSSRPELELRSSRVFLDPPLADAVLKAATNSGPFFPGPAPYRVLTYLVNSIQHGERTTPYSMITASEAPLVPADLRDDEILINQWLADDLNAGPGSMIDLSYFHPDQASQLTEVTNRFRVRAVLPMTDPALDQTLLPDFPGIAEAEKAGDWNTGFPLTYKIREKDDEYWKNHRGTPKGFITLAAGQRLWENRFGNLTAIRFLLPPGTQDRSWYQFHSGLEQGLRLLLREGVATQGVRLASGQWEVAPAGPRLLDLQALGFRWDPVRAQALAASAPAQDFGQLFLGFSFFLILAALILMALLFQFGLEQRTAEIGTLLALGFRPRRVRWLWLGEGTLVAFAGGVLGVLGGLAYAQGMLRGLTTVWRDAVGTTALRFHATPLSLGIGLVASVVVCVLTIWIVLRRQARQPARELLASEREPSVAKSGSRGKVVGWIALGSGAAALGLIGWALFQESGGSPPLFFGAGSLLLVALLGFTSVLLRRLEHSALSQRLTLTAMGLRGCTRRRSRSLACVALLACGSFLIVAVGANRLDAGRNAHERSSGTGGFALLGESSLPVVRDLNTATGRDFYGLNEADLKGVSVVPFRVRAGDDASCLNLNQAHAPRLLGVNPDALAQRKAFSFARVEKGLDAGTGWNLLKLATGQSGTILGPDEIPAIGDAASIQWALRKKLGATIDYTDERGRKFKVRLVAGVANSILQGNLLIDEAEFVKRFPGESGHRMFLIDTPTNQASVASISGVLSRALRDVGLELTPTTRRLAAFNAVQNTYLNTFQVLGGLGLLLGSAGLGVVVLRNVLERRGEFGLLQAVGFRRRSLQWLVLSEHGGLLWVGLAAGMLAALAAILPVLLVPGSGLHYRALLVTLAGVFVSGLLWTWAATRLALRGRLLDALKEE